MRLNYLPNFVTLIRILLVIPIILALGNHYYKLGFYLFLLAGVSDGVDGFLARRYNWHTRFGSIADPLADKLLMVSTFLMLTLLNKIPAWLLFVIILRDVVIICGGTLFHYLIGRFELVPSFISKLNTLLQLILIVLTLFQASYFMLPSEWLMKVVYLVLLTNIASLMHYVWIWSGRALRSMQTR